MAGVVYRNICTQYGVEVPKFQWAINRAKVLWEFSFQNDKKLLANQLDMEVVDKEPKRVVVIDMVMQTLTSGALISLKLQYLVD